MKTDKGTPTKFSKASAGDKRKVTVRLDDLNNRHLIGLTKGTRIMVEFGSSEYRDPIVVAFTINREGSTAFTLAWPFTLPQVGSPVYEHVIAAHHVGTFQYHT